MPPKQKSIGQLALEGIELAARVAEKARIEAEENPPTVEGLEAAIAKFDDRQLITWMDSTVPSIPAKHLKRPYA